MNGRIPLGRRLEQPLLRLFAWVVLRIRVLQQNLVPATGGGIIFYNHIHWLDPPLVCAMTHRYAVPLTKSEVEHWPVVGWLLTHDPVIYIRRGLVDRGALQATWNLLKVGHIAVISPEGTRSRDGRLQAAKDGLAFIARQVPGAWLVPCAVTGTPAFRARLRDLWRRPPVTITYGRPFRFRWPEGSVNREVLRAMTDEAMGQLAQLLPPGMRGEYAAVTGQPTWLEFVEG
jgi:1-acyl-sn-glycerol-3-phosphate acyltransferase